MIARNSKICDRLVKQELITGPRIAKNSNSKLDALRSLPFCSVLSLLPIALTAIIALAAAVWFRAEFELGSDSIGTSASGPAREVASSQPLLRVQETPVDRPSAISVVETNLQNEILTRIRIQVGEDLVTFADLAEKSLAWWKKEGTTIPEGAKSTFEVQDEGAFVTVKYIQEVGKRFWYVSFDRTCKVEEWGTATQ